MVETASVERPPASPSERVRHARRLFSGIAANYDLMAELLSFAQNRRWRRFMASRVKAAPGARVLDVATGTAGVAIELARQTERRVVGLDQSEPMLRAAWEAVRRRGLSTRIDLVLGHGERLPFRDASFDAVTFTFLLRYVDDPTATLGELARVLRPGGDLAGLEFHVPGNPVWRAFWLGYTRVGLPVATRIVSPSWFEVGRFLGPSISRFYRRHPLGDQLAMWRAAGMTDVRSKVMSLGGGVVIWGRKRDFADGWR